jgi:hypothetical protein
MTPLDIFLNRYERLRSGWRFAIYVAAYMTLFYALVTLIYIVALGARPGRELSLPGWASYLLQFFVQFAPALLLGWACGKFFEDLPLRSLGWARHRGWLRDLAIGSLLGAASLALAALVATVLGGFKFGLAPEGFGAAFVKTFFGAVVVYVLLAAAEEIMFRGYPLQTMMRSLPFALAALPSSAIFAYAHTENPNVPRGTLFAIMFANTALAGVWLAVGYFRTRSLWFPLGLHWAWNWLMGSVLGLPVSGNTGLTRAPLLHATDAGPVWLTGGAYGIEGGLACTLALLASILFVWRTRLVSASEERRPFTDGETPTKQKGDAGEVVI